MGKAVEPEPDDSLGALDRRRPCHWEETPRNVDDVSHQRRDV